MHLLAIKVSTTAVGMGLSPAAIERSKPHDKGLPIIKFLTTFSTQKRRGSLEPSMSTW